MDKKQQLLDHENYLLKEIEHYEKRIEEALKNETSKITYNESDSSDLEYELKINNESSLLDLKLEKKQLKTCYLATAELADITIVQSEMNILPQDPDFDGEPISEPGEWKEVMAECRIGMVPFLITFFSHQASRLFAPISFRNLRVMPIKKPQEMELSKSVLPRLTRPSDVIQLLHSYESAYRSRRTTLANLSDKYGDFVSLEAKAEGGYIIKCDEILKMSWTLQNKNSYLSRFQHKMSFDLEYIDESYVKIIRKANKKLENQSIQTDERTQLLAAIINACLEAKATLESKSESENERVKTPQNGEIMAPPKTIPKKSKRDAQRSIDNSKKAKTDQTLNANKYIVNKNPQPNQNTDNIPELIYKNVDRNDIQKNKSKDASEKASKSTDSMKPQDKIIKTGNTIDNKKRKIDDTEKLPVKKLKPNISKKENGKSNAVSTDKASISNSKENLTKQNSNTNLIKSNDRLKPKNNQNKEINKNDSNADNQKVHSNNTRPTNTQNKEINGNTQKINKTGNSQKINEKSGNPQKLNEKTANPQKMNEKSGNLQKPHDKTGNPQKINDKTGNPQKINEKATLQKINDKTSNPQKMNEKINEKTLQIINDKTGNPNKINNKTGNTQKINAKPGTQNINGDTTQKSNLKIQKHSNTKRNTPSKMLAEKGKSLGSGGKSKIPQKKPEFRNPLLLNSGKIKPSSLLAKSKATNIPVKRP